MFIKHNITAGEVINAAQWANKLVELKGAAKQFHKLSHQMAASAVIHAHQHGDTRFIANVLEVMPKGAKTNNMRNYFLAYAPVKWSDAGKKFKFHADKQLKNIMDADGPVDALANILNTHWSSCGPQDTADNFKPFDLQAKLINLLNAANKKLEEDNGPVKRETMTAVDVNKLAETIRTMFPEAETK